MKRTIIAAALIAGAFMSAHADYAASDNIYGIINIPIEEGYNAIGVNLLPMPGTDDNIEDVVIPRVRREPLSSVTGHLLERVVDDGSHHGLVDLGP